MELIKACPLGNCNSKAKMLNKTKYGINRIHQLHSIQELTIKLPLKFAFVTDLDHTLIGIHSNHTYQECNDHIKVKKYLY